MPADNIGGVTAATMVSCNEPAWSSRGRHCCCLRRAHVDAERGQPRPLAESQREALRLALGSKVLVITGGPGVGKTTLVNSILRVLAATGVRIALATPTGRAAKRLSASMGREARTIHRLRHGLAEVERIMQAVWARDVEGVYDAGREHVSRASIAALGVSSRRETPEAPV